MIALFASIIMVVSLTLGLYSYNKKATEEEEKISISRWMLVFFMLLICLNTGIGGFTGQTGDWSKHNAVLHDLIEYRWPVVYTTSYGDSMLSYYIGEYLLPAVIGKIFYSFHAAELMMYAFSVFGLYLVWLIMVAGNLYPENFPYGSHEWMNPYTVIVQYSANWSLLKWVPGQVIVPWLATLIFLLKPEKIQAYVMMGLPVLLFSGFAMVGLVFMMLAYFLCHLAEGGEENIGKKVAKVFSLSNLMLAAIVGSICILYFTSNLMEETIIKSNLVEGGRRDEYGTLEQFADFTNSEIADDLKYKYYSYDLERDIFYQYLAK